MFFSSIAYLLVVLLFIRGIRRFTGQITSKKKKRQKVLLVLEKPVTLYFFFLIFFFPGFSNSLAEGRFIWEEGKGRRGGERPLHFSKS